MQPIQEPNALPHGKFILAISIHIFLFIGMLLWYSGSEYFVFSSASTVYSWCVVSSIIAIWLLVSWGWMGGELISPYCAFLIAAIMFSTGQAILEVFSLNPYGLLNNMFSDQTLIDSLFLVNLGLWSTHCGGLFAQKKKGSPPRLWTYEPNERSTKISGWIFFILGFGPMMIVMQEYLQKVAQGGYFELYSTEVAISYDAWYNLLAPFNLVGNLLILSVAKKDTKAKYIATAMMGVLILCYFFIGLRTFAMTILFATAWIWHTSIQRIQAKFAVLAGISVVAIFPVIFELRNLAGEERLSYNIYVESFQKTENPLVLAVNETGNSLMTVAWTLELVPDQFDYNYGADYFYALTTALPNLFWSIHPAVARQSPGIWLVWTVFPEYAERGGAFGYHFIAEAYLNFGWYFSPVILFLVGYGINRLFLWTTNSTSYTRYALLASFLIYFYPYVRNDSYFVVRPFVWYIIIPFFVACFVQKTLSGSSQNHQKRIGHA